MWSKSVPGADIKMCKLSHIIENIDANDVYDMLHDPDYRKTWDEVCMCIHSYICFVHMNK